MRFQDQRRLDHVAPVLLRTPAPAHDCAVVCMREAKHRRHLFFIARSDGDRAARDAQMFRTGNRFEGGSNVLHQKNSATPAVSSGWGLYLPVFSPQSRGRGNTLSGFEIFPGSKLQRTRCMVSRSGSEYIYPSACCFSLPTPCSPVIEPPWSTHR